MTLPIIYRDQVKPAWLDYNGHMNEGYYGLAFGFAIDTMFIDLGLERYHKETGLTFYSAETHIMYLQELVENDPIHFTAQIVGIDQKRLQFFYRMIHSEKGYVAATSETMHLHYDQRIGKVVPMQGEIYTELYKLAQSQADLPVPEQAGRSIKQLNRIETRE